MKKIAKQQEVSKKPVAKYPLVEVGDNCRCAMCGRRLKKGHEVPRVGVLGRTCMKKYHAIAEAAELVEAIEETPIDKPEQIEAMERVVERLRTSGFSVGVMYSADGSMTVHIDGGRDGRRLKEWHEISRQLLRDVNAVREVLA